MSERTFSSIEEIEYELMPDQYEERLMDAGPEVWARWCAHQLLNGFREALGQEPAEWDPVEMREATDADRR